MKPWLHSAPLLATTTGQAINTHVGCIKAHGDSHDLSPDSTYKFPRISSQRHRESRLPDQDQSVIDTKSTNMSESCEHCPPRPYVITNTSFCPLSQVPLSLSLTTDRPPLPREISCMTPPSQIIAAPQAQPVDLASLMDFFTETAARAAETAAKRHEEILNRLAKNNIDI